MITVPKNVLYYGQEEALPEVIPLRAGPLSLAYENGDLRYIRLGTREVLRRVYAAVRDRNWGTVQPRLSNVKLNIQPDSFHITYDVECRQGDIDFFWQGAITGEADGAITFKMEGEARSTFLRNRLGFCILHPMECAGAAARIEHVDGSEEESRFPVHIAPQYVRDGRIHPVYPFAEMRALAHQVTPDVWAEVRFEGDIFEMEDQRNWIDASYKTYCTPLRLPFPVQVERGTKIAQSVTLRLIGAVPPVEDDSTAALSFTVMDTIAGRLPRLGLGVASHGGRLTDQEINRLKALRLSHLRVDVHLGKGDVEAVLRRATDEARALDVALEVALHLTNDAENELQAFRRILEAVKPPVCTWLIFHEKEKSTRERWIKMAREYLADYSPEAKLGSGTNVFFTELNCEPPPAQLLDLVVYSINPTVHAIDNASVVETLQAHAPTVESARQFSGRAHIAVSPVTFRMRFNPNATGPEPETPPGELPPQVDPRQMSLFGAGWTMGSIKYLAESRVYSATYYETTGWRGVMETEAGSPAPHRFRSIPGGVFPLYHVLADVGEFADALVSRSSQPLTIDGLALRKDGRLRVLLANFTGRVQRVTLHGLRGMLEIRSLDERSVETAMRAPECFRQQAGQTVDATGDLTLEILPFGVVRIDGKG